MNQADSHDQRGYFKRVGIAFGVGLLALGTIIHVGVVFLTLLITMASYLQNIVLMIDQQKRAIELDSLRVRQAERDVRMLHLMEAVNKACELLVEHAEQAASWDVRAGQRAVEILTILRSA